MPSPFPGMDPFVEHDEWEDFHARFNTAVSDFLSPRVEPRYVVRVERRVYVQYRDEPDTLRRADVAVLLTEGREESWHSPVPAATATLAPVECLLEMPEEIRETYLVVRLRGTREVVTVLELLSPRNKRPASDGRREYLEKRDEVLQSLAHLVELDLLRAGERLPFRTPLPPGDYYASVSRRDRRPRAEVYAWTLREPLPTIPVPLKKGDPDVLLDLDAVFTTVYDRARYDLSLDYTQPVHPPFSGADGEWFRQLIANWRA
jgi:hypothetical protein